VAPVGVGVVFLERFESHLVPGPATVVVQAGALVGVGSGVG
jgi:hypothetical protein